jgi:DNA-binding CsgD family transcriptional regulator
MALKADTSESRRSAHHFSMRLRGGDTLWVMSVPCDVDAGLSRLTRAEREVVDLVLEGCSNAEIARRRGTSVHTAANQLKSVFLELGCSGRSELVVRLESFNRAAE